MDIKELATLTASEMDDIYLRNVPAIVLEQYATRLIAAYLKDQEPVLCVSEKEMLRMNEGDKWIKAWLPPATTHENVLLFAAPPLPEPAPQEPDINSMRPKPAPAVCAAPSSEEVK